MNVKLFICNRSNVVRLKGKQINLATLEELNQMMFDIESLVSEGSIIDKEWDKDSAIDFEEIKIGTRKPSVRSGSLISANSGPSMDPKVSSKFNPSYSSDEPVCISKVLFCFYYPVGTMIWHLLHQSCVTYLQGVYIL